MTDHPLTEARAVELWNASLPATSWETAWILRPLGDRDRTHPLLAPLRAAYDAGREDALKPLDPLAENNGKVIRDVEVCSGHRIDVAILAGRKHLLADWSPGVKALEPSQITEFTTDDRTTRYTREGDTWTAENLDGDA